MGQIFRINRGCLSLLHYFMINH